jgi:hypothetical protein
MFTNLSGQMFLLLLAGFIVVYYLIIALCYHRRIFPNLLPVKTPVLQTIQGQPSGFPHDLIARPVEVDEAGVEILLERQPEEESTLEMLDDDDSILIKEAEKVIEQIQDQISHIASSPPNPEEAFTKIRAIVRQYRIFENTEYFDPINRFIALAVNRDCHIQWTEQELLALWK